MRCAHEWPAPGIHCRAVAQGGVSIFSFFAALYFGKVTLRLTACLNLASLFALLALSAWHKTGRHVLSMPVVVIYSILIAIKAVIVRSTALLSSLLQGWSEEDRSALANAHQGGTQGGGALTLRA